MAEKTESRRHIITAIEQAKKRGRVVVYVDGEPSLELPRKWAEEASLAPGRSLEPKELDEIREQAALRETKETALRLLGRRALTQKELQRRLLSRGLPQAAVTETIAWLTKLGYVDDEEYARQRWETLRQRGWGGEAIAHRLRAEGVPAETVAELATQLSAPEEEAALAWQLATKRNAAWQRQAWAQRRPRLYQYLVRRGFAPETIQEVLAGLEAEARDSSSEWDTEA